MAENQKYNLKDELLLSDEKLTGSLSLLGMTMLTQPAYNNSMRSVMFTSHLKQFVNLDKPHFPGYFTNGENVVGKHSSGYKKAKHDLTVFRKVVKFEDICEEQYTYTLFVFDEKKRRYDVITRKECEDLTEVFGYSYDNSFIDDLCEGDFVPKGSVLYKSTSYDDNMNYGYGLNVPMMYTSEPFTSEDAAIAAESLSEEMTSEEISTVSIGVNQNDFLLNRYGDEHHYQPLPEIGQYSNGEVAVKRTLFGNQLLSDFKDSSLNRIMDSDTCYYRTGKVVDITIYCNNDEIEDNPFNAQILKYLDSQERYYQEIKDTCEEIMDSGYDYTRDLDYVYKRACEFLNREAKWKDNDSVFGNILIELTIVNKVGLQIGWLYTAYVKPL